MSWANAVGDLRIALSDGPQDRLCSSKTVFGKADGQNRLFKTFEQRRVTDFSASADSLLGVFLGISVDGVLLGATGVTRDDPTSGIFILTSAPTDAQEVRASYYAQWFLDSELSAFLQQAAEWLGLGSDISQVGSDFKTAALQYASSQAYQKLAVKMATSSTDGYQLEDKPDEKRSEAIRAYQAAAKQALDAAYRARDDVYTRKGQTKAPRFGTISGRVQNPTRS